MHLKSREVKDTLIRGSEGNFKSRVVMDTLCRGKLRGFILKSFHCLL